MRSPSITRVPASSPAVRMLAVALLVGSSLLTGPGPVSASSGSLRRAEGYAFGTFQKQADSSCNSDGSGVIHYTASHPLSGPHGGTMTIDAVVTVGTEAVPGADGRNRISGLTGSFTIAGGTETITGTLMLAPARPNTPGGTADFMNAAYCSNPFYDAYFQVTARFTASGDQGFSEDGFVKLAGANSRYISPPNLATAEFWVAPEISLQQGGQVDEAGVQGDRSNPPENVGGYPFVIRVFPAPIDDLVVHLRTTDGTAIAGLDYTTVDADLQINGTAQPDYFGSGTVVVVLNDDAVPESVEEFGAAIHLVSGSAFSGSQVSTTAQIFDNDSNTASIPNTSIAEGTSGQYPYLPLKITSTQPVTSPVYACLVPSGGTATPDVGDPSTDYYSGPFDSGCRTTTGTYGPSAILELGDVESSVDVGFVSGDTVLEPDETIEWTIDWIWGAPLPADPTVTITILNDDVNPDANGDGVSDAIAAGSARSWDDDNDPTPGTGTYGRIVSGDGVLVEDAASPLEGVKITTTTEDVVLEMCNPLRTVTQTAGSVTTETCGSVTARVDDGPGIRIYLGPDIYVAVPRGVTVEVDSALSGGDTIEVVAADGGGAVTLVNGDASRTIEFGDPVVTAQTWTFTGFSQPVDNGGVINTIKGGQTVPLKWRITQNGVPVTTLTTAKVSFPTGCSGTGAEDSIEQTTTAVSGLLKNLGNGYYQYNWKTPRTPGACGKMLLDIGDGVQHSAAFRMK